MQGIASKAFDTARTQVGKTSDADLQMYEQLQPEQFEKLVEKFGPDSVVSYIKAMEAKRNGA
jgi:hypothetical protein